MTRGTMMPIFRQCRKKTVPCCEFSDWFRTGLVAQRNRIYHAGLDTQRRFFAGVSRKQFEFATCIFNAGWTDPTVGLEIASF